MRSFLEDEYVLVHVNLFVLRVVRHDLSVRKRDAPLQTLLIYTTEEAF